MAAEKKSIPSLICGGLCGQLRRILSPILTILHIAAQERTVLNKHIYYSHLQEYASLHLAASCCTRIGDKVSPEVSPDMLRIFTHIDRALRTGEIVTALSRISRHPSPPSEHEIILSSVPI
jgi:hypothetical protein